MSPRPNNSESTASASASSESLPERVRAFAARHSMFPPKTCVVALVSGGADSTALLRLLAGDSLSGELAAAGEGPALSVLHVNHLLRGSAADADEAFVEVLCGDLGVEFVAVRYDVAAYAAREHLNLEDAGRRIRYRFAEEELDARCDRTGVSRAAGRVATGHTLDDRVETFFMRAITGAGAGGLSSISPVRGRIVRPVLDCAREDIRTWLREIGQSWREDETNSDTTRLRALIRQEFVGTAESVNPSFRRTLARSLDLLSDDDALLDEMAEAFSHDFTEVDSEAGRVLFDRAIMSTLSRPMARRTIRVALHRAFPEASRLEFAHVEALVDGLAIEGFARDLSQGLSAHNEYGRMVVARGGKATPCVAPGLLDLPGTVDLGDAGSITASEEDIGNLAGSADSVVIDATRVRGPLVVDGNRSGDRMRPFGMEGSRKLSDLFVDAKVPQRERGNTPVVRDGERIVWLAGVRMSEEYRVTPETRRAVRLTWQRRIS